MTKSPDAEDRIASHEAKNNKAVGATHRRPSHRDGVGVDERPERAAERRVPAAQEGDLVVGKCGKSAITTPVERIGRFLIMLGLLEGKEADRPSDLRINRLNDLPALMRGSSTWYQGTEMVRHAH